MLEIDSPDETRFRQFVDEYRLRCLWFLRADYYPGTLSECLRVLALIEQYGDREALQRAARFRAWLSRHFSGTSASS